jgi:opacity protein-like surface antigen
MFGDLKNKMMKEKVYKICLTIVFPFFTVFNIFAQDVIYKHDGTEIKAKVTEITESVIKYKKYEQLEGPIRNILISDVFMIIYEDGTREVFKSKETENEKQPDIIKQEEVVSEENNEETSLQNSSTTNTSENNKDYIDNRTGSFFLGLNYFSPSLSVMKDIYGAGFIGSLGTEFWISEKFGLGVNMKYFNKSGTPYVYTFGNISFDDPECEISIIPISIAVYYRTLVNKTLFYGGPGLGYCHIKESVSGSVDGQVYSSSISINTIDLHLTGGIRFKPIYIELSLVLYPYNGANFGGTIIGGGLFF